MEDLRYNIFEKDEKHFLELDTISILDSGEFTCTASNSMGSAYCAFNITVEGNLKKII